MKDIKIGERDDDLRRGRSVLPKRMCHARKTPTSCSEAAPQPQPLFPALFLQPDCGSLSVSETPLIQKEQFGLTRFFSEELACSFKGLKVNGMTTGKRGCRKRGATDNFICFCYVALRDTAGMDVDCICVFFSRVGRLLFC